MAGEIAEKTSATADEMDENQNYKIREHLKELFPDENKLKELL